MKITDETTIDDIMNNQNDLECRFCDGQVKINVVKLLSQGTVYKKSSFDYLQVSCENGCKNIFDKNRWDRAFMPLGHSFNIQN
jgi:hypothetical protein